MIDTDEVESINREDLIIEYLSLRIFEDCEGSFYSEIGFMIPIDIEYTTWCFYVIECIDEMFESTVHTIEEVSGYTDEFWIFSINFFYDSPEVVSSQYMADVNIRNLNDFFPFPFAWKISYPYFDMSNMCMYSIIKSVAWYYATEHDSSDTKKLHRYIYSEWFSDKGENPYGTEREAQIESCSEPHGCEEIGVSRPSVIVVMRQYGGYDEAQREYRERDRENEIFSLTVIEVSGKREIEESVSEKREK